MSKEIGRRPFVRRAAMTGAAVWAAPVILTMNPASAATLTSPPPVRPHNGHTGDPGPTPAVTPQEAVKPREGELPRTGLDLDQMAAAGVAAAAGGGALMVWRAELLKGEG